MRHLALDQIMFPRSLALGLVGVLIFMIGDGVEAGYLVPYLTHRGLSVQQAGLLLTVYGVFAAAASWLSGVWSDVWGPRRVMIVGFVIWIVFEIPFLGYALPSLDYRAMLIIYGLRGIGYPFFALSFLVWVCAATEPSRLGAAVGWFWFAFTGGLPTLGSLLASVTIPLVGEYATFWISLGLVFAGGMIVFLGVREKTDFAPLVHDGRSPIRALGLSLKLMVSDQRIAIGTVLRCIDTTAMYGFLVVLPLFFTREIGFSTPEWLRILSCMFVSNIVANAFAGIVGDALGWRRSVALLGGLGCTITTLLVYYVPLSAGANFLVACIVGAAYGFTLAGFCPIAAIMTTAAPDQKGAALAAHNLGAGASVWVGPGIATLLLPSVGTGGVMIAFSVIYLVSVPLTLVLRIPEKPMRTVPIGAALPL